MVLTVHKDDYNHSKEAFVSGMTGSTVSHINVIALVALVRLRPLFYTLHLLNDGTTRPLSRCTLPSAHAHHHRTPFCYFSEWLLLVVPLLLSMTLLRIAQGTIRRLTSSHRVHMLLSPATPVWYTSTFWRLSPRASCPTARRILTTTSPPDRGRRHPRSPRRRVCPR
jgi:hypothetical protein